MSPFWILLELRMMKVVVVTTGAIRSAMLHSKCHHHHPVFTGRMPWANLKGVNSG